MKNSRLIKHIKTQIDIAALNRTRTAVSMYYMLKHAEQLGHIDAELLAEALGHKPSYGTEIKKARKVAAIIRIRGL